MAAGTSGSPNGNFLDPPARPYQVNRQALARLALAPLAAAFEVSDRNALVGLSARLALLRRLGEALADRPDCIFLGQKTMV